MNEKFIREYMTQNKLFTYEDVDIDQIQTVGDLVMFRECDKSGYYCETHQIPLLDMVTWVFSLVKL